MLEFLQHLNNGVLINLQSLSNFAVFGALIFTILTFFITTKNNKRSEQIRRVQEIQRMLSNENQNMIQNLFNTLHAPLALDSSEDNSSSNQALNRGLYQPVVDAAEWASFLMLNKDIDKCYEKHLRTQIQGVYSTVESLFPELLENGDNYAYLRKIIKKWKK